MVKFGPEDLETCMNAGHEAAKLVSKLFVAPISLEFEKCYFPWLLLKKKRYVGLYWTNKEKWDKVDCKGIERVRRETCKLVPELCDQVLNCLLIEKNIPRAVQIVKTAVSDLYQNKIDMSLLIMGTTLGKEPEDYAMKCSHAMLVRRLQKRDPSTAPRMGDRVPYVFVGDTRKKGKGEKKKGDVIEDPLYALEKKIPLSAYEYVEKQLRKPFTRMFEHIIPKGEINKIWTGEHTLVRKPSHLKAAGCDYGILKFVVRDGRICQKCRSVLLPTDKGGLCRICEPSRATWIAEGRKEEKTLANACSNIHQECVDCWGELHMTRLIATTWIARNFLNEPRWTKACSRFGFA